MITMRSVKIWRIKLNKFTTLAVISNTGYDFVNAVNKTMASKFSPIFRYTVKGKSMEPEYKQGDEVLVSRLAYLFTKPDVGDVVVIKHPGNKTIRMMKRIVRKSGSQYFVEGDNYKNSTDSRHFGPVTRLDIVGKVIDSNK